MIRIGILSFAHYHANFWAEAAEEVHWDKKWDRVLDDSAVAVLSMVPRRIAQYLLQCARSPRRKRAGESAGAHLR